MFAILQLLFTLSLATGNQTALLAQQKTMLPLSGVRGAYLVRVDATKTSVIFSQNPDVSVPLASITKLMTAIVLSGLPLDMAKTVLIKSEDIKGGAIPYLIPGDEVSVKDLWDLMLIVSSNDAAAALVRETGMNETAFVKLMNTEARALGMTRTHFADVSGLSPLNVSTPREIVALGRVAFAIPTVANQAELGEYVFTPKNQASRRAKATNLFTQSISLPGFELLGTKTGHIEESGYNLVVAARNNKSTVIGVVAGAQSVWERFTLMRSMLNHTN